MKTVLSRRLSDSAKHNGAKILLLLTTIIWGSSFFILKNTLDEIPVFFLLSFRFLFSALLLAVICWKKWKLFNLGYLFKGGVTGIFLAFAYIFQTLGLQHTTPGTNAFLTTVYCILVPFMGWAVTKRRPGILNIVAAVVCVTGIGLVCMDGSGGGFSFEGEGYTLICGLFFALHIVAVGEFGKKLDTMLYTVVQFATAFLICMIFFFATGESFPRSFSTESVLSLVYVTVLATCVCFVMMNVGIKYASPVSASLILSLEAVFGVAFSMIFYRERLTLQVGLGFLIIFAAIVLSEVVPEVLRAGRWRAFASVNAEGRKEVYIRSDGRGEPHGDADGAPR